MMHMWMTFAYAQYICLLGTFFFFIVLENNPNGGNHTIYASNSSGIWENGTVLYRDTSLPTEIYVDSVFRYMIYVPPIQDENSSLEVCEVGIVGKWLNQNETKPLTY